MPSLKWLAFETSLRCQFLSAFLSSLCNSLLVQHSDLLACRYKSMLRPRLDYIILITRGPCSQRR